MSTHIQWTDETWNPVVGCTKISAGCKNCYAKTIHDNRHKAFKEGKLQNVTQYAVPFEKVQLMHDRLTYPLSWKKPRKVFVNSVSDLFHEDVPFGFIDQVFAIMARTPQHTYQVLTKRPERMAEYLGNRMLRSVHISAESMKQQSKDAGQGGRYFRGTPPFHDPPLPNVWLGTSVENQAAANERIPHLLRCDAQVRFLSMEPLLGPVDIVAAMGEPSDEDWDQVNAEDDANDDAGEPEEFVEECEQECDWINFGNDLVVNREHVAWRQHRLMRARMKKMARELDWVIIGGESGHKPRPFVIQFARNIIRDVQSAGRQQNAEDTVRVFVKQLGSNPVDAGEVRCSHCFYYFKDREHTTPSLEHPMPIKLKDHMGGEPNEWPEDLRIREWPPTDRQHYRNAKPVHA